VAPATAGTENVMPVVPKQGFVFAPVGAEGAAGMFVTVTARGELNALAPHAFEALAVILPATAPAPAVTVIVLVVAPAVMVQPAGTVHA
jgi:hypothetical protein